MNKVKLIAITMSAMLPLIANANDDIAQKYIEQYILQVAPQIEPKISQSNPSLSEDEVRSLSINYSTKMAECQLESITHYPTDYIKASTEPVARGESIQSTTQKVNMMFRDDINSGRISQDDFRTIVETATSIYKQCMS